MTFCAHGELVEGYALGLLDEESAARAREHVEVCAACREELVMLREERALFVLARDAHAKAETASRRAPEVEVVLARARAVSLHDGTRRSADRARAGAFAAAAFALTASAAGAFVLLKANVGSTSARPPIVADGDAGTSARSMRMFSEQPSEILEARNEREGVGACFEGKEVAFAPPPGPMMEHACPGSIANLTPASGGAGSGACGEKEESTACEQAVTSSACEPQY